MAAERLDFSATIRRAALAVDFEGNPYINISLHAGTTGLDINGLARRLSKDSPVRVSIELLVHQPDMFDEPAAVADVAPTTTVHEEAPAKRGPGRPRKASPETPSANGASDNGVHPEIDRAALTNAKLAMSELMQGVDDYLPHHDGTCKHRTEAACDADELARAEDLAVRLQRANVTLIEVGMAAPEPIAVLMGEVTLLLDTDDSNEDALAAVLNRLKEANDRARDYIRVADDAELAAALA